MSSILVIDDESQIRTMLKQMLENEGHTVKIASDGKKAMEIVSKNSFDLVITDLIMPDKEGLETIIELKNNSPDVKIIAISGGGRIDPETLLQMAGKLGADHTFKKPIKREELMGAVNGLLRL